MTATAAHIPANAVATRSTNPGVATWLSRSCGTLAAVFLPAVLLGGMLDGFDHVADQQAHAAQLATVTVVAKRIPSA